MGRYFTALFRYNLNTDLDIFCSNLEISTFFPEAYLLNKIDNQQPKRTKPILFNDTLDINFGSITYMFNQHGLGCLYVNRRWGDFLDHFPTTESIRKICSEAMEYFNSTEAIYLYDMYSYDYFYSNMSWSEIKQSLFKRLGPPAIRIRDIYKEYEDHVESDGYFIEQRSKYNN